MSLVSLSSKGEDSPANQVDRLTLIEKVEASKVASDVAKRIATMESQSNGHQFVKTRATKRDYLLACSAAHAHALETAHRAKEKVLKVTTQNAQDDPAIAELAAQVRNQTAFSAYTVAAWPLRGAAPVRGTYVILLRLHNENETVDTSLDTSPNCR